jgi:DNA-binding NarL/FixJ family response regulator
MDLTIPDGMGGKEAIQEILAINPKAKVVVSSGYSDDPIMSDPLKYGFVAAISKPYQIKDLTKIVSSVLKN